MSNKNEGSFHPVKGYRCKYLRDRNGNPFGIVMTHVNGSVFRVGWSLCNRKLDTFKKMEARRVAAERMVQVETDSGMMCDALEFLANSVDVPHTISQGCRKEIEYRNYCSQMQEIDDRMMRYAL